MGCKALDFYTKGLPIEVRQPLLFYLKREISETMVKWFLEKERGYPSFRSCGFSDDDIRLISASYAKHFEHANDIMSANGRPPLFSNPHDSFLSAREHAALMQERSDEELIELFGCTYRDYEPPESSE